MSILSLNSVGHAYLPEEWLFKSLDFELAQGEHVAIQGTSGCGKSTLLNIMAGLEVPSDGEVFWSNQPTSAWSVERRRSCRQTCLLYTSPSPRDRQKSRMPSSA